MTPSTLKPGGLRAVPRSVWAIGLVSMFMDISSEMIHGLMPIFLAGVLLALRAGGQAIGWGFQLQSPTVTAGLALLMLAVGLNLSGVFHVGAGVQGLGSGPLARAPGGTGAFLTGVLAVVVAAPCTAPFMAVALGAALVMNRDPADLTGVDMSGPFRPGSRRDRLDGHSRI